MQPNGPILAMAALTMVATLGLAAFVDAPFANNGAANPREREIVDVCGSASVQDPAKVPAHPAPQLIAQWEQGGGRFGWMRQGTDLLFRWHFAEETPRSGDFTAFQFLRFPAGKLKTLSLPETGLALLLEEAADAELKELAGLKRLRLLDLKGTNVTDVGVQELARLEELEVLNLARTQVTDAGLKKLTGLSQLRNLILSAT